jgi:hypothetical protein
MSWHVNVALYVIAGPAEAVEDVLAQEIDVLLDDGTSPTM